MVYGMGENKPTLVSYSDADFAGDRETRSTTGKKTTELENIEFIDHTHTLGSIKVFKVIKAKQNVC